MLLDTKMAQIRCSQGWQHLISGRLLSHCIFHLLYGTYIHFTAIHELQALVIHIQV